MFCSSFSFDTPRSPTPASNAATATSMADSPRSVSPCSTPGPLPSSRFTVTDLAAQFASQRIERNSQVCYDSCEPYANNDDDAAWAIPADDDNECRPLFRSRTFPQRPHSPSIRARRQINTRLLCTTSHHRDIAQLVSRMVESEEQCCVSPVESVTTETDEDEGYNSSDETMTETSRRSSIATTRPRPEYRRASDLKTGGACVSKSIRRRKDRNHRRTRSSENSS